VLSSQEVHDLAVAIGCDPGKDDLSGLRYGKVIILADADSDGLHIATLLSALFLKHFPALVREGHAFVAMPPLFRVDVGKQVFYCLDESERDAMLEKIQREKIKGAVSVTRFKGLGEPVAAARIHDRPRYAPPRPTHRRAGRRHEQGHGHAAVEEARQRPQGVAGNEGGFGVAGGVNAITQTRRGMFTARSFAMAMEQTSCPRLQQRVLGVTNDPVAVRILFFEQRDAFVQAFRAGFGIAGSRRDATFQAIQLTCGVGILFWQCAAGFARIGDQRCGVFATTLRKAHIGQIDLKCRQQQVGELVLRSSMQPLHSALEQTRCLVEPAKAVFGQGERIERVERVDVARPDAPVQTFVSDARFARNRPSVRAWHRHWPIRASPAACSRFRTEHAVEVADEVEVRRLHFAPLAAQHLDARQQVARAERRWRCPALLTLHFREQALLGLLKRFRRQAKP
jgi:hypothetical protein